MRNKQQFSDMKKLYILIALLLFGFNLTFADEYAVKININGRNDLKQLREAKIWMK